MVELTLEFEFRNKRYADAAQGLAAFARQINKDWDGSAKVLSRELKLLLDGIAEALQQRHGGSYPGGTSAQTLSRRTGTLTQSIIESVTVKGTTFDTIQGTIGANTPYAAIQEFGGVIKPKGKFLAIPLPAAMDSRGVPLKRGPREWDKTFVAKSKAGNLIIFQKRGTSITPLYVLKTSVTIPPRLGMQKTINAGLPYFVDRAMDQMVKAIIEGKG